jgi:2Fe-2S ferredoxin
MVKITFIDADGKHNVIDARLGQTIMEAAVKNDVAGIAADCGGQCACGTCRIYPDAAWADRLGKVSGIEAEMLEFSEDSHAGVRLSCQIAVSDDLDGLTLHLPRSQH